MADNAAEADADTSFGAKLQQLFTTVLREDGTQHRKPDVAAAIGVSRGYLYDLLAGKNEPSHAVVVGLAKYFDVEVEYFSDTERGQQLQDQFALLADLGANNVRQIAHRARGLDPEALSRVLRYIDFEQDQGKSGS